MEGKNYSLILLNFTEKSRIFLCLINYKKDSKKDNIDNRNKNKDRNNDKMDIRNVTENENEISISSNLLIKEIPITDMGFINNNVTIKIGYIYKNMIVQIISSCLRLIQVSRK